jgi:AAA+ ATPase superfamily predicted ATPase/Holliday junction resolvase
MFSTSTPVTAERFHNRKEELARLERAIDQLQAGTPAWMAIIGPRKIGKTSLVLESVRQAAANSLLVATLDVHESAPASMEIFRLYALRVLDAAFGSELGESLERLARRPSEFRRHLQRSERFATLPAPIRAELLELVDGRADAERVAGWLQLPELLARALDLRLIVAIDEFEQLDALSSQRNGFDPFTLMRSVWQKHTRVAYFVSGSARSLLLTLVTAEHSPFFQHFAILDLGPFGREDAISLLEHHSPPQRPISHELAARAVETIGGHPFYLQLLGETLTGQRRPPDKNDLKAALQDLLFSRTGRLGLYFENEYHRLVGRSTFLAATLGALAEGPLRLSDVASKTNASSGATVRHIERLKDAVQRREDGLYQLSDATFGLWLRWRQPGGSVVPMAVVGNEAEQAVAYALAEMGFDLVYQSKASRGAFDLLATRGAMQLGVQVKRSKLPLRFSRPAWSRMEAEAKRLGWSWIVAAVNREGEIAILDPARARKVKAVQVNAAAQIDNLLLWLDQRQK